jgi:acetoin utilization deacetylase AcuC-like enzyme
VRAVAAGQARNAFCLASPGGHHAEAETAQGFCFFNHVALAAAVAQAELGVTRVAVLDFDAHHGNGTQSLFWNHADRMLVSLHEDIGLSGFAHERGAQGNILNLPLATGTGSPEFRIAVQDKAVPALAAFQPELLLVSAGFDMCEGDPMAGLRLQVEDYAWIGKTLAGFADEHCGGRLVAVMEGGYNLETLGECATAFTQGLIDG